jgi:hypothetical protein
MTAFATLKTNRTHDSQRVLDHSGELLKSGTTPVLLTPREMELGLGGQARGSFVVLSPSTPQGRSGFTFDPAVDFSQSAPDQEDPK